MKRKKIILKAIVTIVSMIIAIMPYLDWNKKNQTLGRFFDLGINQNSRLNQSERLVNYCDTVSEFISKNPINIKVDLNCNDYNLMDSTRIEYFRNDFMVQVKEITRDYHRQERRAGTIMFIILITSQILAALIRRLIDKRFKRELIDASE